MRALTTPRFTGATRSVAWVGSRLVLLVVQQVTFAITRAVTGDPFLDHTVGTNFGFGLLYIPLMALVASALCWVGLEFIGATQSRQPESRAVRRACSAAVVLVLAVEALVCGGTLLLVVPNYPATVAVIAAATGADVLLLCWLHRPALRH
ncbi:hypothetical protein DEI97_017015 [Curtobacterium sp. MCLR17_032]|uniref:hypothetical protein n=1 Tax=Curtobacterium sp. MCLR17_032 TaxID=2175650 RepID=UPI0011B5EBDA|nr:hypothetical protein [Curtobacterium sp. MCLR17_032]WIE61422.1 hypothetical protein DEI97_017015 [Curtobacterium sp. MCLR17_032]